MFLFLFVYLLIYCSLFILYDFYDSLTLNG